MCLFDLCNAAILAHIDFPNHAIIQPGRTSGAMARCQQIVSGVARQTLEGIGIFLQKDVKPAVAHTGFRRAKLAQERWQVVMRVTNPTDGMTSQQGSLSAALVE